MGLAVNAEGQPSLGVTREEGASRQSARAFHFASLSDLALSDQKPSLSSMTSQIILYYKYMPA